VEGEERKSDSKVVKCSCGKSKKMPFCDNSHRLPWHKLTFRQKVGGVFYGMTRVCATFICFCFYGRFLFLAKYFVPHVSSRGSCSHTRSLLPRRHGMFTPKSFSRSRKLKNNGFFHVFLECISRFARTFPDRYTHTYLRYVRTCINTYMHTCIDT
jgi:hypothetical protein